MSVKKKKVNQICFYRKKQISSMITKQISSNKDYAVS